MATDHWVEVGILVFIVSIAYVVIFFIDRRRYARRMARLVKEQKTVNIQQLLSISELRVKRLTKRVGGEYWILPLDAPDESAASELIIYPSPNVGEIMQLQVKYGIKVEYSKDPCL
jgi:hypothetical protein